MELVTLVIILILFSVIVGVAVAFLLEFAGVVLFTVPYLPSRRLLVSAIREELSMPPGSIFYDLGSGDGRIVRAIAKTFPQSTAIGIELAPLPLILSAVYSLLFPLPNARFITSDFRSVDLSTATHIYCYLLTDSMNTLLPKLEKELKPGTILVSCDFKFEKKDFTRATPHRVGHRMYILYKYVF